jgi:hypothetical protein
MDPSGMADWGTGIKPKNWGVDVNVVDANGKSVHQPDGVVLEHNVQMSSGKYADGTPQSLYYDESHEHVGVFKGMGVILEERGFEGALRIRAQCPKSQCERGAVHCCCR